MKKVLPLAVIAVVIVFIAAVTSQGPITGKAQSNSLSDNDCLFIGSPVFRLESFHLTEKEHKESPTNESNTSDAVTETPINMPSQEELDEQLSEFTESEVPGSNEAYSSKDILVGEIARSDVKMTVGTLRYETVNELIDPSETSSTTTIVTLAAAPPVRQNTLLIETANDDIYPSTEENMDEAISVPSPDKAFEKRKTQTPDKGNEELVLASAVSVTEKADQGIAHKMETPETVSDTDENTIHNQTKLDVSSDIKNLQKIWRRDPRTCIELAGKIIEKGDYISSEDLAEAWYRKGRAHRLLHEPVNAIEAHKMAAEINPQSASYLNGYAWILSTVRPAKYRNHVLALEKANEAVSLSHRKTANYLDTLGRTLFVLGHQEEAFEAQKEAVALEPGKRTFRSRLKKYESALIVAD